MLLRFNLTRSTLPFLALLCSGLVFALIYELELHRSFRPRPDTAASLFGNDETRPPVSNADRPIRRPARQPVLTSPDSGAERPSDSHQTPHPIDDLVKEAASNFSILLSKQTTGVHTAAEAYRARRGRHPPPLFDKWVAFAETNNAVMIEEHFDRIYQDLDPFWALPTDRIKSAASSWAHMISIRDGRVLLRTDTERQWLKIWSEMISQIAAQLPDLDIPMNELDEPRVLVPWESVSHLKTVSDMRKADTMANSRQETMKEFSRLEPPQHTPDAFRHEFFSNAPMWTLVSSSCPPDSPARINSTQLDLGKPPIFDFQFNLKNTYHGYVTNWTYNIDPCHQPHLAGLHGSFVEPISLSSTRKLVPLFTSSKLSVNNDILLPAARYWIDDDEVVEGFEQLDWQRKNNGIMWRGSASGGRNRDNTWRRFHRHRFVSMVNGSHIHAELDRLDWLSKEGKGQPHGDSPLSPDNFPLPDTDVYRISATAEHKLAEWVDEFSDAAFTFLNCFPIEEAHGGSGCSYTDPFFGIASFVPPKEQFLWKYLPVIDGTVFSDRFRSFLRSASLPVKASVYAEWHDSRLIPWKHFVPMDNMFYDFYGIMEYFIGYKGGPGGKHYAGHDSVAEDIAMSGREWAKKVLRKEDMLIYIYRLLLEYARVCDEHRAELNFVSDILPGNAGASPQPVSIPAQPLSLEESSKDAAEVTQYQKDKASGANWKKILDDPKHLTGVENTPIEGALPDEEMPAKPEPKPQAKPIDLTQPAFQNDRIEEAADSLQEDSSEKQNGKSNGGQGQDAAPVADWEGQRAETDSKGDVLVGNGNVRNGEQVSGKQKGANVAARILVDDAGEQAQAMSPDIPTD